MSGNTSESQAASYDRDNSLYPYKSHGQWLKAFYGLAASAILVLFNGVPAFLDEPFNIRRFVSAYAGVSSLPTRLAFPNRLSCCSNICLAPRVFYLDCRL